MSPTEIPIIFEPHKILRDDQGLTSWRPVLTSLSVHGVAQDHNARHLVVREDGEERYRFRLGREDADHLARLLTGGTAS
ncbi:hypothetical protein SQ03_05245 [Methylobacterium platani JCM 14648]|uniref:Uncharacterized protein n=2 Tax=Methylobacterium platani TaxID=427683 RepID=A0A179S5C8_9HYPH|nr:hypothetical protein SQ03_05245 [Methylobacterium platani JCM 14648]OAS22308.1 hypothetical protein A5481_19790 [Methylobacterium platani]